MNLRVNEIYGPVKQGEGKSVGLDVMFLRLSGCNLACSWCDTPYTWNWIGTPFQHPQKYDRMTETHFLGVEEVLGRLYQLSATTKAVVISGGEPFLQQDVLVELVRQLVLEAYWVEVETNATIVPSDAMLGLVNQFNCSPKLLNSGPDNRPSMIEKPHALMAFAASSKTTWKFVVQSADDLDEVKRLVARYAMHNVYLMPEGTTRERQEELTPLVERLCADNGFLFSPRLHVLQHGDIRAV